METSPKPERFALAWVGIGCGLAVPLVAGNLVVGSPSALERSIAVAVPLLGVVALLTALAAVGEIPMDLSGATRAAWRVAPHPVPALDDVPGAVRDAVNLAGWAFVLVVFGATRLDSAGVASSATDAAQGRLAAVLAGLGAVGVLGFAAAWPSRVRRAVRHAPLARQLVVWPSNERDVVFVAPPGATRRSEMVAIPVRRGAAPDGPLAGTFQVHGDLRPWRVAVIRTPDGGAMWPRGGCLGALRTGLRRRRI